MDKGKEFYEEGSTSGQHRTVGEYRHYVAPTTGTAFNRIRLSLWPVACWRMNHAMFEFDSSFIPPRIAPELVTLKERMDANPECPMSIFGHADPSGDDEYNKKLSGRRARAMYALLTHNADMWEELFNDKIPGDEWGPRSTQSILTFLRRPPAEPEMEGDVYYHNEVMAGWNAEYDRAVKDFQSDNGLPVDGDAGPKTRRELYRLYMKALWPEPTDPDRFLGDPNDPEGKGAYQGCGEFNPVRLLPKKEQTKASDQRNEDNAPNRRVMIFFFEKFAKLITKGKWPCPTWKEGAKGCKAQFWPDGDERRKNGEEKREYKTDQRTMACRSYDKFARLSSCEGVGRKADNIVVYLYVGFRTPADSECLLVVDHRGTIAQSIPLQWMEPSGNGFLQIELDTYALPNPFEVWRSSEMGIVTLLGPCSPLSLEKAFHKDDYEHADQLAFAGK